jgi:hypothetical protein
VSAAVQHHTSVRIQHKKGNRKKRGKWWWSGGGERERERERESIGVCIREEGIIHGIGII